MRIAKWDNIKFVLIYFVVLGHTIATINTHSFFLRGLQFFIYTFHMPAFLFISGLFSKRAVDDRRYDRIIPYFFLYIFMVAFRFLFNFIVKGKPGNIHFLTEEGVPWFALTLFLCYLITVAVSQINHTYLLIVFICIGILAGYSDLDGFLTGMRLFTFYPFFLAGYCVPTQKVADFTGRKSVRILSAMILLMTLLCSYILQDRLYGKLSFLKGKAGYSAMGVQMYGGLYRGIYYVIAMVLILCVIAVVPSADGIFARWGRRTVQVFALHHPVVSFLLNTLGLKGLMSRALPGYYNYLIPVLALIVTIVFSAGILEPFFNWLIRPKRVNNK